MPLNMMRWFSFASKNAWLMHAARTAIAAAGSLAIARLFKMPEAYWAPISAIIVTQSTLGASWTTAKQRFIGTALGAVFGGLLTSYFEPQPFTFGAAIFVLGLMCAMLHLDQSAYRFAGVAFAIIMLVGRGEAAWLIGLHRFVEVSLGIAVSLAVSALWPGHTRHRAAFDLSG